MIKFNYATQCYVREGYEPFPRSEVVKVLKALKKDGQYRKSNGMYTRLINREPIEYYKTNFEDSITYKESGLYVLLAYSEYFPQQVENYVYGTSENLYKLMMCVMDSEDPGKMTRLLFMLGYGNRTSIKEDIQASEEWIANYRYNASLPPTTTLLQLSVYLLFFKPFLYKPKIVEIFKELVRRGLSIDIYFRGHPLCDQSYRYIILENEAVDGYRRWRHNDLPHPLVKDTTFVSEDYAYYLMKKIDEVKSTSPPNEPMSDAKINYIFAGAREDYVNRSLFDKIREKLINS